MTGLASFHILVLLLAAGTALTFARQPLVAGRYGVLIGLGIGLICELFMSTVHGLHLSPQDQASIQIPLWLAMYLGLVHSYQFLSALIGPQREALCRRIGLGLSVRRVIAPFFRDYSRASLRSLVGPDWIAALPRIVLLIGVFDLAALVIPLPVLFFTMVLCLGMYALFFAAAVGIVVKSWDVNRRFDLRD